MISFILNQQICDEQFIIEFTENYLILKGERARSYQALNV